MFDKIRELERLREPEQNDYLNALTERIFPIKGKAALGEFCVSSIGEAYSEGARGQSISSINDGRLPFEIRCLSRGGDGKGFGYGCGDNDGSGEGDCPAFAYDYRQIDGYSYNSDGDGFGDGPLYSVNLINGDGNG